MIQKNEPKIPLLIAGGNGYVSGELMRLAAAHPHFYVAAVSSQSHVGQKVLDHFAHLAGPSSSSLAELTFSSIESWPKLFLNFKNKSLGLFLATPHTQTAKLAETIVEMASRASVTLKIVDLSADFRFEDTGLYEKVYGAPHGAVDLLKQFYCGCPDLGVTESKVDQYAHFSHPGCFTTSVVLASYPFVKLNLVEPEVFVSAITGSSGSGRTPIPGTHHPERNSNLLAYSPLGHRHEHEMRFLLSKALELKSTKEAQVFFVPHSGPFVRGIYATLKMTLKESVSEAQLVDQVNQFYAHTPFVRASQKPPKLTDVVGTNRCQLGVAVRGKTLVVMSAIDNMIKGSAGGGMQWMNHHFNFAQTAGLEMPGLGWY